MEEMVEGRKPYGGDLNTTELFCGTYVITHTKSKKKYVGSSKRVGYRLCNHRSMLKSGNHMNPHLQEAYNEDPNITTVVYETPDRETALELEQALIDEYHHRGVLFNVATNARSGSIGRVTTDEMRYACGSGNRGKTFSDEHRQKIASSNTGKIRTQEMREAASAQRVGIPLKEEQRAKIDALNKSKRNYVSCDGTIYHGLKEAGVGTGLGKDNVIHRVRSKIPKWSNWFYVTGPVSL